MTFDESFRTFAENCKTAGLSLVLLSNDISEWSAEIRAVYGLDDYFDRCLVSGEVGIRKPDPAIFERLLAELSSPAEECVYLDDNPRNLAVAEKFGIQTMYFNREVTGETEAAVTTFDEAWRRIESLRLPVRRVAAEDLPECHTVVRQSFATVADEFGLTEQNCPTHTSFIRLETLQSHFAGGDWMIGYWKEGRIVGFAAIHNKGGGVYELQNLAVLPSHRRAGYGRDLLSCAVEIVRRLGGEKLTIGIIEDNTKLKNWYARNGFLHMGTKRFSHLPFTVGFMEYPISR